MANNRLYLVDPKTGQSLMLAKGFGRGWCPVRIDEDAFNSFFADRDEARGYETLRESDSGPTDLLVMTECQLAEFKPKGLD